MLSAAGLLLASARPALASPITFNFEELALSAGTAVITSTQNGLTATIQREDGANLSISDLSGIGDPSDWGDRSIGNFVSSFAAPGGTIVIDFSAPISSGQISFGDYGGDDDSPVTLTAFSGLNATGSALGTSSASYTIAETLALGQDGTLSVSAAGINSLTISSGGSFPNSLYFDNLVVSPPSASAVPEPSSLLFIATGLAGLAARRRAAR